MTDLKKGDIWEQLSDIEQRYKGATVPTGYPKYHNSSSDTNKSNFEKALLKQNSSDVGSTTAVVLTALRDPEYTALQQEFADVMFDEPIDLEEFPIQRAEYRNEAGANISVVFATQIEMGMTASALRVSRLAKYRPRYFIMCGICAGIEGEANIGDLIVPQYIFDYNSGKVTPTIFKPDLRQARVKGALVANIENLLMKPESQIKLSMGLIQSKEVSHKFKVRTEKMATGAGVIASEQLVEMIQDQDRKACAIEMEAYGFVEAVHDLASGSDPIVMKAVCDYADSKKNDRWQGYAAALSARACRIFLDQLED